jgi:hypothetical protein
MPSSAEIKAQVARETHFRGRLAVPAFAGGFLYLLSAIIISGTLSGAPTVGLLQGLTPALKGVANPAVSPRTPEVKFVSHHAFALIAGSLLAAVAVGVLTLVLLALLDATRFRRPTTWAAALPLVIVGGVAVALVSLGHQIASAIETHNFVTAHNYSNHAVEQALTAGTANTISDYVDLLAGLALAAGMVATMINALRVGLLPRWMAFVGMFAALLIFLPIGGAELQLVPAFWLVMMGILFVGRWPKGDPPAWAAGEARPWPSQAQLRAEAKGAGGSLSPSPAAAGATPAPAPAVGQGSSSRRRRKRSGRS